MNDINELAGLRPNQTNSERCKSVVSPRLFTRAQAMAYLALSGGAFSAWIREGRIPGPLRGTRRWDRHSIDAALDRASGLNAITNMSPLDRWRSKRDAGSPSRLVRDL
jgi:hypothetical protein